MSAEFSIIDEFVKKWNQNDSLQIVTPEDILRVESELNIQLPISYKYLITHYGDLYTPETLEAIVRNDIEISDVQDFELPIKALESTKSWQKAGLPLGYYAFASDSMGNMFCFKNSECNSEDSEPPVWFFDHDFVEIEQESKNFTSWLKRYNEII